MLNIEGATATEMSMPPEKRGHSLARHVIMTMLALAALAFLAFRDEAAHLRSSGLAESTDAESFSEDLMTIDVEEADGRRLGARRRRRRRKSTPAPAPAPDYSSIMYPEFIALSNGWCEDFGYETITGSETCLRAGVYLSGDTSQEFHADMPSGGWISAGTDRPAGCVREGTGSLNPLTLHYFPNKHGESGVNDFQSICARPSSFHTGPVEFMIVRENRCETFGYEQIGSLNECRAAGIYLARDSSVVATSDTTVGASRPAGCAFHSSSGINSFSASSNLIWFSQSSPRWPSGDCGVANFDCICRRPNN